MTQKKTVETNYNLFIHLKLSHFQINTSSNLQIVTFSNLQINTSSNQVRLQ